MDAIAARFLDFHKQSTSLAVALTDVNLEE
jgi:hypothetical protein